jgi:hypothetical protein
MLNPDGTLSLPEFLPAETLLGYPDYVKAQVESYFVTLFAGQTQYQLVGDAPPVHDKDTPIMRRMADMPLPTPEGLATHVGFANFKSMQRAIEDATLPERSRHFLLLGCSMIADVYTKAGLTEALNQRFLKFLMSAYLDISEKNEVRATTDSRLVISWQTPEPSQLPTDTLIELERLEKALPATMRQLAHDENTDDIIEFAPTSELVESELKALKELLA